MRQRRHLAVGIAQAHEWQGVIMGRMLALDVGEARIGVAVSDATGLLASPYTTIYVTRDETKTWDAIVRIIEEAEIEGLVVGLPISLDGQIHAQGERIMAFVERMKPWVSLPITFWDERLSTVEAERLRAQQGRGKGRSHNAGGRGRPQAKRRRQGHEIDALAASVILQEYLDAQRSS
ncbi:Holliday junction resolvase RuvX [Ktedonospora formicarum]|uniref:Putative pre-16S rRNA nuclease n=1 Tax=Ktedonospora formicarum TaxID=2778364 RepID=A0A8J3HUC1_9CHLR|nr:Holliday junction resolvase RuvX [Ktedonospora formicarum]GHO43904.1 putative pre-16S rRNA nuclease [Ktedonospora formicarum]